MGDYLQKQMIMIIGILPTNCFSASALQPSGAQEHTANQHFGVGWGWRTVVSCTWVRACVESLPMS